MAVDPKKKADFEAFRKRARKFPVPRQELQARVDCRVELESQLLEIEEKKTLGFLRSNTVERGDFLNIVPVNGSKGHPYGKKKSRKPERVSVYFVRFRSKRLPFYKFLKIGISNVGIGVRFTEDSFRYDLLPLGHIGGLKRSDALKIERQLHEMFADAKHVPEPKLVCGGNSECFENNDKIVEEVLRIFKAFNSEIDRLKKLT